MKLTGVINYNAVPVLPMLHGCDSVEYFYITGNVQLITVCLDCDISSNLQNFERITILNLAKISFQRFKYISINKKSKVTRSPIRQGCTFVQTM